MLLLSSTDRIGALHFQTSSAEHKTHGEENASIDQLIEAVALIESGQPLPEDLNMALMHGTSVGGARPKALIQEDHKKFIAKFSASTDPFPIVQAEYASMVLAKKMGLDVADVRLVNANNKFVLLVERFDRERKNNAWSRKFVVSALTLLGLDEIEGHYASYIDLSDLIRRDCKNPTKDLE